MTLPAIPQAVLKKLEQYDTPTVCNVIELFAVRPQTEGVYGSAHPGLLP